MMPSSSNGENSLKPTLRKSVLGGIHATRQAISLPESSNAASPRSPAGVLNVRRKDFNAFLTKLLSPMHFRNRRMLWAGRLSVRKTPPTHDRPHMPPLQIAHQLSRQRWPK